MLEHQNQTHSLPSEAPFQAILLSDRRRKETSPVAIKLFFRLTEAWALSNDEKRALLGGISKATFHNWEKGKGGPLSRDQMERISLCMGIEKGLKLIFAEEAGGHRWLKGGNSDHPFNGQSPLGRMINEGIYGLYQTRAYLDAWRGIR